MLTPFIYAEKANVLFFDQLVNVGFSYSSDGSATSNTLVAAKDIWSFLEPFFTPFPESARTDFYLAAESYGGHYALNIASVIYKKIKKFKKIGNIETFKGINVKSVIFTNGITEPYTHLGTVPDFLCTDRTQYLISMDPSAPSCQHLIKATCPRKGFCSLLGLGDGRDCTEV
jgi:cathepsin A (carboxypeptidase C)